MLRAGLGIVGSLGFAWTLSGCFVDDGQQASASTTSSSSTAATSESTSDTPTTTTLSTTHMTTSESSVGETEQPDIPPSCPLAGAGVSVVALDPLLFANDDDPLAAGECDFSNPQRGFTVGVDLRTVGETELVAVYNDGVRVINGHVPLPEFLEGPLDENLLGQLQLSFDRLRTHGLSVVPRFYYSDDGPPYDPPLDTVLEHIEQLQPLLEANEDIILAVQAGFVGESGEWFESSHNLNDVENANQILGALLGAIPVTRQVQVRKPVYKQNAFGGPLTPSTAYDDSALARVGHHNQCFLGPNNDIDTYSNDAEKTYAIADSAFVATGGTTCIPNPPDSDCPTALTELAQLHWTYLAGNYHPEVITGWNADGCLDEIGCRLGYRLVLTDVRFGAQAQPGEPWSVSLTIHNDGFAAPVNARPMQVYLTGPGATTVITIPGDIRTLAPGEETTFCVDTSIPMGLPLGDYTLGLRLPAGSTGLNADPRYAIRVSGGTWGEQTGVNHISGTVAIVE